MESTFHKKFKKCPLERIVEYLIMNVFYWCFFWLPNHLFKAGVKGSFGY